MGKEKGKFGTVFFLLYGFAESCGGSKQGGEGVASEQGGTRNPHAGRFTWGAGGKLISRPVHKFTDLQIAVEVRDLNDGEYIGIDEFMVLDSKKRPACSSRSPWTPHHFCFVDWMCLINASSTAVTGKEAWNRELHNEVPEIKPWPQRVKNLSGPETQSKKGTSVLQKLP